MSLPPLDYSYRGITYIEDIRYTRPRKGLKPYKRSDAGRFWCSSFRLNNNNIVTVSGIYTMVQQGSATTVGRGTARRDQGSHNTSELSSCLEHDFPPISLVHYLVFEIPENLTWLDLSFNKLTSIDAELSLLTNIKILYLHGNLFTEFKMVLPELEKLENLYSLTLHGNPIEEDKNYRQRILSVLPRLKNLDFTNVTNADLTSTDLYCLSKGN